MGSDVEKNSSSEGQVTDVKAENLVDTKPADSPSAGPSPVQSETRLTIVWKITFVVVMVMTFLAVINILFIRNKFESVMADEFESKAKAVAFSLAGSTEDKLISGNVGSIQSLIDGFKNISGISYVYVTDDSGTVVAHTFSKGFPKEIIGLNKPDGDEEFRVAEFEKESVGSVLEVGVPILFGVAGTAHVAMDKGIILNELKGITNRLVIQFGVASIIGIILLHMVIGFILRHIKTVIDVLNRVGQGDLTARVEVSTRDEFLVLADHLNNTLAQLGAMVKNVRISYVGIMSAYDQITTVYGDVLEGMEQEAGLAVETMESVQDNKRMIDEVTQGIHVLETSANDSFSSIMEMGASIEEVSSMSESLFQSVIESNQAIEGLSSSIDDITHNLLSLSKASDETSSAMNEMSASIVQVRGNAENTSQGAIDMTKVAEEGAQISKNAMIGIHTIKDSSEQVSLLISNVTERIEEIDEILSFITDITGKTNLLALNAAIIAAQAGAQGKGFGVVADEINELAQNTKAQTNRIAHVIEGIRENVTKTGEAVEDSHIKVEEGVKLTEGVTGALEGIMESTLQVSHMVEEIAQTTAEQANTSSRVLNVAEHLTGSVDNIRKVSAQQSESGEKLLEMSKNVQTAAEKVRTSTDEQTTTSQQINKDLTRISETVRNISEATEMQAVNGTRVLKMTEDLTGVIDKNKEAVQGLHGILTDLNKRMAMLQGELKVFVVDEV